MQQQAPPSYGQLIAQGAIPPVEDFPTENPNDNSVLGNLRSLLQILRQDMTPGGPQVPAAANGAVLCAAWCVVSAAGACFLEPTPGQDP